MKVHMFLRNLLLTWTRCLHVYSIKNYHAHDASNHGHLVVVIIPGIITENNMKQPPDKSTETSRNLLKFEKHDCL